MILDYASRMVLAGGEFTEINTENSMLIIDQLVDKFWWLCPLRELILDHGSEFGAHRIQDDGSWNGFSENTSSTGLLFIHSTSLSLGITIDLMEA